MFLTITSFTKHVLDNIYLELFCSLICLFLPKVNNNVYWFLFCDTVSYHCSSANTTKMTLPTVYIPDRFMLAYSYNVAPSKDNIVGDLLQQPTDNVMAKESHDAIVASCDQAPANTGMSHDHSNMDSGKDCKANSVEDGSAAHLKYSNNMQNHSKELQEMKMYKGLNTAKVMHSQKPNNTLNASKSNKTNHQPIITFHETNKVNGFLPSKGLVLNNNRAYINNGLRAPDGMKHHLRSPTNKHTKRNLQCNHHFLKIVTPTYSGDIRPRFPLVFTDSDASYKSKRSMRSRPVNKTEVIEVENGQHRVVTKQQRLASAIRAS